MASKTLRTDNLEIRAESSRAVRRDLLKKGIAVAVASGGAAFLHGGNAEAGQQTAAIGPSTATDNARATALDILLAKQDITEVIYRYSRGIDRMDKELALSVWNPGATFDFRPTFTGTGPGFIDWVWEIHKGYAAHSHQMVNILIKVTGNTAVSETYGMISLHGQRGNDGVRTTLTRNRYLDRWSRHNGVWGIDHRKLIVDFSTVQETTGALAASAGRRDKTDPSYEIFGS